MPEESGRSSETQAPEVSGPGTENAQPLLTHAQLLGLGRLGDELRRETGLEAVCERLVESLVELAQLEDCVVFVRRGNLLVQVAGFSAGSPAAGKPGGVNAFPSTDQRVALPLGYGVCGIAGVQRSPIYVRDTATSGDYVRDVFPGRSEYAVPMIHNGELVGIVDSESRNLDGINATQRLLLRSATDVAAANVASLRNREAGTNSVALNEVVAELAGRTDQMADDIDEVLALITERAAQVLNVTSVAVWLLQGDKVRRLDKYLLVEQRHLREGFADPQALEWYAQQQLDRRVLVCLDARSDPTIQSLRRLVGSLGTENVVSTLHAPIRSGGEMCGLFCVNVEDRARDWTDAEVSFAASIADLISLAVVTAQKNVAEAALVQAQRLESLGLLAGGVAHDFNNLLTVISGGVDLLLSSAKDDAGSERPATRSAPQMNEPPIFSAEQENLLKMIAQAGERARVLTRQLLAFGRKQRLTMQIVDARELLDDALRLGQGVVREDITVEWIQPEEPCWVDCDRAQLNQTLMNLLINAVDALPLGGQLRLSVQRTEGQVIMRIADDGAGIADDIRERVFEPFFTTKGEQGSGLGLAVGYGILQQHNGELRLARDAADSLGGATFEIVLPEQVGPVFPGGDIRVTEPNAFSRIGGRVLLVEDESEVRFVVERMLVKLGFDAVVARDGGDALRLLGERDIALLITDVVMPDVRGPELYALALERQPDLKVLFMSGYAESSLGDLPHESERACYLSKPFSLQALESCLFELLQRESERSPLAVDYPE